MLWSLLLKLHRSYCFYSCHQLLGFNCEECYNGLRPALKQIKRFGPVAIGVLGNKLMAREFS